MVLSNQKKSHLELVYSKIKQNIVSIWSDALFNKANIDRVLVLLNRFHVVGHKFLSRPSLPHEQKSTPFVLLEQKGKKPHEDSDSVHGPDEASSESKSDMRIPFI